MKKTRNEIELRIATLQSKGIQNAKLVAKWERILRRMDSQV